MQDEQQDKELQKDVEQIEEVAEQPLHDVQESVEEVSHQPQQEIPKRLEQQPKQIGAPIPGKFDRLKSFITECKRVLRVTKKPDKQEFTTIVKISSIGMAIIGIVGFLIHFAKELLF